VEVQPVGRNVLLNCFLEFFTLLDSRAMEENAGKDIFIIFVSRKRIIGNGNGNASE
jgi:hypothetical protein